MNDLRLKALHATAGLIACLGLFTSVSASAQVLVEGAGVTITVNDLLAETLRMAPAARKTILSSPAQVSQMAFNLYARRQLGNATRQSIADDPAITLAALALAQDRYLSDIRLQRLDDENKPSEAALEQLARTTYKAEPKRFMQPEEIRVRHILIKKDTPDAKAKADDLLRQLRAGASFEALALEFSADPGSAAKGGDLGFIPRGRTVPPFEAAAFALNTPGELAGPVESPFGLHIIRLEERRPGALRPFVEVHDMLIQEVTKMISDRTRNAEENRMRQLAKPDIAAIDVFAKSQR